MADDGDRHRRAPHHERHRAPVAPATCTGNTYLVEDVLAEEGITDLEPYSTKPGTTEFLPDFFVDPAVIR